jgi:hypothetical protein
MRERQWCNYPVLIIVLRLGPNDAQPLITRRNTLGTNFLSTVVLSPKYDPNMVPTDVLEAMLPVIGCHHPKNMALTMFRGLRLGNHVS